MTSARLCVCVCVRVLFSPTIFSNTSASIEKAQVWAHGRLLIVEKEKERHFRIFTKE